MKKTRKNQEGQATTEFALMLLFVMSLILFFMQLSLSFAWANYIHYATFMSARAYLAGGDDQSDQTERAKNVLAQMVKKGIGRENQDRFPAIAKGVGDISAGIGNGPIFDANDRNSSWMQGVRYTFRSRLFLVPLAGSSQGSGAVNSLTLTSERWLGREKSYSECMGVMASKGIIDNGC